MKKVRKKSIEVPGGGGRKTIHNTVEGFGKTKGVESRVGPGHRKHTSVESRGGPGHWKHTSLESRGGPRH